MSSQSHLLHIHLNIAQPCYIYCRPLTYSFLWPFLILCWSFIKLHTVIYLREPLYLLPYLFFHPASTQPMSESVLGKGYAYQFTFPQSISVSFYQLSTERLSHNALIHPCQVFLSIVHYLGWSPILSPALPLHPPFSIQTSAPFHRLPSVDPCTRQGILEILENFLIETHKVHVSYFLVVFLMQVVSTIWIQIFLIAFILVHFLIHSSSFSLVLHIIVKARYKDNLQLHRFLLRTH